jgi:hypothetical protein
MHGDWRKSSLGLLVVIAVLLTLGTIFQDYLFERSLTHERATLLATEREVGSLEVAVAELAGAQARYLTDGEAHDFSLRRGSEIAEAMGTSLTRLRESTRSQEARARYDAALTGLSSLSSLDRRARELVETDQRALAADVLFGNSLEASQGVRGELSAARAAEQTAADERFRRLSRLRFALTAFAMAAMLIAALYVGRPAKPPKPSEAATLAQMLRELPPPVRPASRVAPALPPPPPPVLSVNLPDTADLCVDLARVIDSRDVPALLERAASVLDAKGIILWIAEAGTTTLRPSISYGYSDKVLRRLGTLDVNDDNVTSLAFRSMSPQMMNGAAAGSSAAVTVPLVTATGCSGVLSAEIRECKPASDRLAVAKILAAQFAALIAPADAGSATKAAEA